MIEIVGAITDRMLIELWDELHEEEGMPDWDALTPREQNVALTAVLNAHLNVDELHPMVDAVQELRRKA